MTATITIQVSAATPAQIDGEISRLQFAQAKAEATIERIENIQAQYVTEKMAELRAEAEIELPWLAEQLAPLYAEFTRRGGWNRYYLVEGGHLHFDCTWGRCSRVPSTRHYFMTDLSGRPADEVIELAGDRVCTTCFPGAPVEAQNRPSVLLTKDEETKAAERQERAEKAAQKAAKAKENAILDPETGEALRIDEGRYYEIFKTERAAWIYLVDQMWYQRFYGRTEERTEVITTITKAIAAKHGQEFCEVRGQAVKKLEARIKREG